MGSFSGAFKPVSLIAPVEVSLIARKPVFGVSDGVFSIILLRYVLKCALGSSNAH